MMERETRVSFGPTPHSLSNTPLRPISWQMDGDIFLLRGEGDHYFHYRKGQGITVERGEDADLSEKSLWLNGSVYSAIVSMPADEIARLYGRSQELGAGRAAGQALLLADSIYGTLAPCPSLRDSVAADGRTRWLFGQALSQLAGRPEPVEPTAGHGGTLRIHLSQFFLAPGMAFKVSEFVRQARAAAG